MDFLKTKAGGDWAPSSERVLATTNLVPGPGGADEGALAKPSSPNATGRPAVQPLPPPAPPLARPMAPAPESPVLAAGSPRPAGFGPPRRPLAPNAPPALSPADLEALERLSRKEPADSTDLEAKVVERRRRTPTPAELDRTADQPRAPAPAPGRRAESKTLAEILAELDGADIRLPPSVPPARPRRGPVVFAAPKSPAADPPAPPLQAPRAPVSSPSAAAPPVSTSPATAASPAPTSPATAAPAAAAPPAPQPGGTEAQPAGFGTAPSARPARPARGPVAFAPPGKIASFEPAPPAIAPDQPEADFSDEATAMSVTALLDLISGGPAPSQSEAETAAAPEAEQAGSVEPDSPALTTWWPPAEAGAVHRPEKAPSHNGLGPVPSKYRPAPGQRTIWRRLLAVLLVAAIGGTAATAYVVVRRQLSKPGPNPWDPRVTALAQFVQSDSAMSWGHPVAVRFLAPGQFPAATSGVSAVPGPLGANAALWVSNTQTIYVDGTSPDIYTNVALVGQLTEAVAAQHPGLYPGAQAGVEAARVQAAYVRSLSPANQATLHREQRAGH